MASGRGDRPHRVGATSLVVRSKTAEERAEVNAFNYTADLPDLSHATLSKQIYMTEMKSMGLTSISNH